MGKKGHFHYIHMYNDIETEQPSKYSMKGNNKTKYVGNKFRS